MLHLDSILPAQRDFNLLFSLKAPQRGSWPPNPPSSQCQGYRKVFAKGGREKWEKNAFGSSKSCAGDEGGCFGTSCFQAGSAEASLQFEAGLPGKMKQIWTKTKSGAHCRSSSLSSEHPGTVQPWKLSGTWKWALADVKQGWDQGGLLAKCKQERVWLGEMSLGQRKSALTPSLLS